MSYALGIDLGTTFCAAAVAQAGLVQSVSLGSGSMVMPSTVFASPTGQLIVGESAEQRSSAAPDRCVREFKRRFGDPVPYLLGTDQFLATDLAGIMLQHIIGLVADREGEMPESVSVAHPANWGAYKLDLLTEVSESLGTSSVSFVTEPEAAAIDYVAAERPNLETLLVYDLGGGTFDTVVLRRENGGFALAGRPEGIEQLGGLDFDETIRDFVLGELGVVASAATEAWRLGLENLRLAITQAKIALSADTEAAVPVLLPDHATSVVVTQKEFEDRIRPLVGLTIDAVAEALSSAEVASEDLDAVLLVGGSSRIPLVSEMLSTALDRPVRVDADPKNSIAKGAARRAAGEVLPRSRKKAASSATKRVGDSGAGKLPPVCGVDLDGYQAAFSFFANEEITKLPIPQDPARQAAFLQPTDSKTDLVLAHYGGAWQTDRELHGRRVERIYSAPAMVGLSLAFASAYRSDSLVIGRTNGGACAGVVSIEDELVVVHSLAMRSDDQSRDALTSVAHEALSKAARDIDALAGFSSAESAAELSGLSPSFISLPVRTGELVLDGLAVAALITQGRNSEVVVVDLVPHDISLVFDGDRRIFLDEGLGIPATKQITLQLKNHEDRISIYEGIRLLGEVLVRGASSKTIVVSVDVRLDATLNVQFKSADGGAVAHEWLSGRDLLKKTSQMSP